MKTKRRLSDPVQYASMIKKMSDAKKGEKNPNFGKARTKMTRKKISKSGEKKWKDPIFRAKHIGSAHPMYGKTGKDAPRFGKHQSEKAKKLMSDAKKGEKNPMYGRLGSKHPRYGTHQSNASIIKIKDARAKQVLPFKNTKIEVKIQAFLNRLGIEFFSHQYIKIEHGYQCDILIPSMNMVIECDGDAFHFNPEIYKATDRIFKRGMTAEEKWHLDRIRTDELVEKGFKVLRLWEHEITEMDIIGFEERLELAKERTNE